jgi:hypothetical protein
MWTWLWSTSLGSHSIPTWSCSPGTKFHKRTPRKSSGPWPTPCDSSTKETFPTGTSNSRTWSSTKTSTPNSSISGSVHASSQPKR